MIKVERPALPDIGIYKDKKFKLAKKDREFLLTIIEPTSPRYGSFINRLKDSSEKYTKAERETLRSIAFYANPAHFKDDKKLTKKKGPTFDVFKDKELAELLKSTFQKKCAYCESRLLSVSSADIEHFRPKGAINRFAANKDESLIFPGYYWLAADWDNLLWSCGLCNRKTNQEVPDLIKPQLLGKKNRFPVADERLRIRSHNQDLTSEQAQRLILNPCKDEPAEHLFFPLGEHDLGIVKSVLLADQKPSKIGEASIPVYGLNRVELVFERHETAVQLQATLMRLLRAIKAFYRKLETNEDTSEEEKDIELSKISFRRQLAKTSQFLALKHHLMEEFDELPTLKKLNLKVSDLL